MHITRNAATLALGTALLTSTALSTQPAVAATPTPTDGWAVTTLQPSARRGAAQQMVLLSPTGKQYRVARVGALASIVDLSRDGRRVLYVDHASGKAVYRIFDLRTRRVTAVAGAATDPAEVRFSNPSGTALLVNTYGRGLLRTTLGGSLQARYAGTKGSSFATQSPDGLFVVSQSSTSRLQVNGNKGALVRTLPTPKGYRNCMPGHWTSRTQLTGVCFLRTSPGTGQVFRFDVRGTAPVALTTALPTKPVQYSLGYQDHWRTPKGTVVAKINGCGSPSLARVRGSRLSWLPVGGDKSGAIAITGRSITYLTATHCGGDLLALHSYDLGTGRSILLAGGTANRGMRVTSAVVLDRTR
ncbi:hypothetical protein [Luteococcus sp. OSA5]|uniref:hypothetical protein n=1 Tax=Luteococcus sp. OSA5 TaxID=3401630 RepID=UPI003B43B6B6